MAHSTDQLSRVLGACSSESGAWLNAPLVSSLGLRIFDDAIRTTIGQSGCPHIYVCPIHVTCLENLLTNLDIMA